MRFNIYYSVHNSRKYEVIYGTSRQTCGSLGMEGCGKSERKDDRGAQGDFW